MSVKTKEQLKQDFSDNQTATGAKFADLIDSLKAVQSAVSDPSASGMSITFIATISQDTNGVITVTKKTVNFAGYKTLQEPVIDPTVAGEASAFIDSITQDRNGKIVVTKKSVAGGGGGGGSYKPLQSAVPDPSADGTSITFIATISQNENGVISPTKKTVDFSGYQTVTGMASYQANDKQVTGDLELNGSSADQDFVINHNKGYLPSVKIILPGGLELRPFAGVVEPYRVFYSGNNSLTITITAAINTSAQTIKYYLD